MTTSNKIMKLCEYNDYILFKAACSCLANDHDLMISIEEDPEFNNELVINFSANVSFIDKTPAFKETFMDKLDRIIANIFYRTKKSLKLLFTGYLEMDTCFLLSNEEDINDFLKAISGGLEKIKTNKNKKGK